MHNFKFLVNYYKDCGRAGNVQGLFVTTEKEIESIVEYGSVWFGEILGKHSNIVIKFTKEDFNILTEDQVFIDRLVGYIGHETISGYNPLHFMAED